MKKILMLLLLSLSASAALFAVATPLSADPGSVATPQRPTAQVCYHVDNGEDVKVDVTLATKSFGKDGVQVRKLVMLCELSTIKTFLVPDGPFAWIAPNPPPVADTSIYACYALRGGDNPGLTAFLKTPNFGSDKVVIGTSDLMCESAKKHVHNPDGSVETYGTATNSIWQCFRLADGDSPNLAVGFANNNFGADFVKTEAGTRMCQTGVKHRMRHGGLEVTGNANGVVRECFGLDWADDEMKTVVLETENFGRDEVVVRKAVQICQVGTMTKFVTATVSPIEP